MFHPRKRLRKFGHQAWHSPGFGRGRSRSMRGRGRSRGPLFQRNPEQAWGGPLFTDNSPVWRGPLFRNPEQAWGGPLFTDNSPVWRGPLFRNPDEEDIEFEEISTPPMIPTYPSLRRRRRNPIWQRPMFRNPDELVEASIETDVAFQPPLDNPDDICEVCNRRRNPEEVWAPLFTETSPVWRGPIFRRNG
jgi:hypothetical protein